MNLIVKSLETGCALEDPCNTSEGSVARCFPFAFSLSDVAILRREAAPDRRWRDVRASSTVFGGNDAQDQGTRHVGGKTLSRPKCPWLYPCVTRSQIHEKSESSSVRTAIQCQVGRCARRGPGWHLNASTTCNIILFSPARLCGHPLALPRSHRRAPFTASTTLFKLLTWTTSSPRLKIIRG